MNILSRKQKFSWRKTAPFAVVVAGVGIIVVIIVSAAGAPAAFEPESGTLSGGAVVASVTGQSGTGVVKFAGTPTPTATPTPTPTSTPGAGAHRFPYSFTDSQFFSSVTTVPPFQLGCETRTNQSVIAHAEPSAIINNCGSGTSTLRNVRLGGDLGANGNIREGYRCGGSGTMNIQNSWLEAKGSGDDHADVVQCYDPGNSPTATMNVTNTTIRAYNTAATAGLFVADNYAVDIHLTDVLFWGGPFGLRVHTDGRPGKLYANNVCFYGTSSSSHSFGTAPILMNPFPPTIVEWNNVNWCTINNGVLTVGSAIPRP